MTSMLRKAAIGAVATLTLGAGVTATATPSIAQGWHGDGWHGGGWYGGRGYGWGGGYYGGGWGGPVAAGVIGGLALGALAGSAYAYGPAYIRRLQLAEPGCLRRLGQFFRLPARPSLLLILGRWRKSPAKRRGFNFFSISI